MISYPFIKELFTNVLKVSSAIEGRLHITPRFGLELNSDSLGELLTEAVTNLTNEKQFPLALMMPPRSRGQVLFNQQEFEAYQITMFFLKTTYYGEGANINPNTQTSLHTVDQDWHDMKRVANDFIRVLDFLVRKRPGLVNKFRIHPDEKIFNPVSTNGVKRASGIQVNFTVSIFTGCLLEDISEDDLAGIVIPADDSHPIHPL